MAKGGSVIIKIDLNSKEISKNVEVIKSSFVSMGKALTKAVQATATATRQAQDDALAAAGKYQKEIQALEGSLKDLQKQESQAGELESAEYLEAAQKAEALAQKLADIDGRQQDLAELSLDGTEEFQKLEKQANRLAGQYAEAEKAAQDLKQAEQEAFSASIAQQIGQTRASLEKANQGFQDARNEAQELAQVVPGATREVQKALQAAAAETAKVVMPQPNKYLDEQTNGARVYAQQIALVKNEIEQLEALGAQSGGKAAEKYTQLSGELEEAKARHRELTEEMEATGPDGAEYAALSQELKGLQQDMQGLTQETQRYKVLASEQATDIEAQLLRDKRQELAALNSEYQQLTPSLGGVKGAFQGVGNKLREFTADTLAAHPGFAKFAAGAGSVAQGGLNVFKAGLKGAGGACKMAFKAVGGITNAFSKMGKGLKTLFSPLAKIGKSLKTLGAAAWKKLASAVTDAVKEGVTNLSQYSGEVGSAMSGVKTAFSQMGNQIAASFAPLITAVAPILQYVIGLVTSAANAIGQLFAVLTGSGTFIRAKEVQEDYAGSLEGTGAAAKEAKGELAGFDKISVLSQNDASSGSGGGGGGAPDLFETVEVEDKFKDLASYVERLFAPIKEAWDLYGEGLINAWRSALENTIGLVTDIASTFLSIWENGTGLRTVSNLLILLTDMGLVVNDIAVAFRGAWGNAGESLLQSFFDMLNNILELIHSITESFRNAWNDGLGESILTHIFGIITNIQNTVANLAEQFRIAWESGGLGNSIMEGLLLVIDGILEVVDNITLGVAEWASNLDFEPFLQAIDGLLQSIYPLVQSIGEGLMLLWDNVLAPLFTWICESALPIVIDIIGSVVDVLRGIIDFLIGVFTGDWELAWEGIKTIFSGVWDIICSIFTLAFEIIVGILSGAWEAIKAVASTIASWFYDVVIAPTMERWNACWSFVKNMFSGMWDGIKKIASTIANWFKTNVAEPISRVFEKVGEIIGNVFEGVKSVVRGVINAILGFINGMMSGMAAGINTVIDAVNTLKFDIPSWVPVIGGQTFGFSIPNVVAKQIPLLAHGAVIPPNREFLAVLGDQSHGRNLEAPEGLIREILRDELGAVGGDVNIRFTGSLAQLARVLKPEIEREAGRRGGSLAHA